MARMIEMSRTEAEFTVDALEATGDPQCLEFADYLRQQFGMSPLQPEQTKSPA